MNLNTKRLLFPTWIALLISSAYGLRIEILPLNEEESDSKFKGYWTYVGETLDTVYPLPAEASKKFTYRYREEGQNVKHVAYLVPEEAFFGIQIEPFASKPFDLYKTVMFYHARAHQEDQLHNYNTPTAIRTTEASPPLNADYSYTYSSQPDKDEYYWVHTEKEGKVSFIHDGKNNIQIANDKDLSKATKMDDFHHVVRKYCQSRLSSHSAGLKALCTNVLLKHYGLTPKQMSNEIPEEINDSYLKNIQDYSLERFNKLYRHFMEEDGHVGKTWNEKLDWIARISQVLGTIQTDQAIIGLARDKDNTPKCVYIKLDNPISDLLELIEEIPQEASPTQDLEDEESTQPY